MKPKQIVIAGEPDAPDTRAMLRLVHDRFIPNKILLLADGGPAQQQLAQDLPFLKGVSRKDGRATAYICENYVCRLPTSALRRSFWTARGSRGRPNESGASSPR